MVILTPTVTVEGLLVQRLVILFIAKRIPINLVPAHLMGRLDGLREIIISMPHTAFIMVKANNK